jgi:cysteine-rich repeat protein
MRLRGALLSLALIVAACGGGDDMPADDDDTVEPDAAVDPEPDAAPPEDHCGDGVLDPDEQCDDGGKEAGDGCAATCFLERCGDGVVDDGQAISAWLEIAGDCADVTFAIDGTTVAQVEIPCICHGITTVPLDAAALALLDGGEHDLDLDAWTDEGGGLAWATLVVETSWPIGPLPADRTTAILVDAGEPGDAEARNPDFCDQQLADPVDASATIRLGEVCDDGDRESGDGCRADCKGTEQCQDGLVDGGEGCDDGNALDGDGCTAACVDEYCGDGVVNDVVEACEDGNAVPGDGCEPDCRATCGNGVTDQPLRFLDGDATIAGVSGGAIVAGIVDADADSDLVVVGAESVHALLSDGAGGVTIVTSAVTSGSVGDVTLVDYTGDGHLDLLISSFTLGVGISAGDGAGNFASPNWLSSAPNRHAAAADFDGDGRVDVLLHESANNTTWQVRNLGNGSFVTQAVANAPATGALYPLFEIANVDGDPAMEVLAVRNNELYVIENAGPSLAYGSTPIALPRSPAHFAAADVDGDGSIDAALGDSRLTVVFDVAGAYRIHERVVSMPVIATTNLDADAAREILAAGSSGAITSVYVASAEGTRITAFGPALDHTGSWLDLTALDLDGDASIDLAALDSSGALHLALGYTGNAESCDDGNAVATDGCDACALDACGADLGADRALATDAACYLAFPARTWAAAADDCVTLGGHLASIPDLATDQLLAPLAPSSAWIGLTDAAIEGTWVWNDGTPFAFTNWNSGEPNNSGNEDCVHLLGDGRWNDLPCTDASVAYLCEVPLP